MAQLASGREKIQQALYESKIKHNFYFTILSKDQTNDLKTEQKNTVRKLVIINDGCLWEMRFGFFILFVFSKWCNFYNCGKV